MPMNLLRHLTPRMHKQQLWRDLPLTSSNNNSRLLLYITIVPLCCSIIGVVLLNAQIVNVRSVIVRHGNHTFVGGMPFHGCDGCAVGLEACEWFGCDGGVGCLEVTQIPYREGSIISPTRQQITHQPIPTNHIDISPTCIDLVTNHGLARTPCVIYPNVSTTLRRGQHRSLRGTPLQIFHRGIIEIIPMGSIGRLDGERRITPG
mmetsp:Transcript_28215/g.51026  ORF Transcript_28215/g.51026 Transcript_28215/m.51026 type:complete len:204 (+) Transcript_28215:171-782(+)